MLIFRILLLEANQSVPGYEQIVNAAEILGTVDALLIAIVLFLFYMVVWSIRKALSAKESEIIRLRSTNDKLEERLLRFIDRHHK